MKFGCVNCDLKTCCMIVFCALILVGNNADASVGSREVREQSYTPYNQLIITNWHVNPKAKLANKGNKYKQSGSKSDFDHMLADPRNYPMYMD